MPRTWKYYVSLHLQGVLTVSGLWNELIPCIDVSNVDQILSQLPADTLEKFRESAEYSDPYWVQCNSDWPTGPTSPEIRHGILAVKDYFNRHPLTE